MVAWPKDLSSLSKRKIPAAILPIDSTSDLQRKARCSTSSFVATASICTQDHHIRFRHWLIITKNNDYWVGWGGVGWWWRKRKERLLTGCLTENLMFSTIHLSVSAHSSSDRTKRTSTFKPLILSPLSMVFISVSIWLLPVVFSWKTPVGEQGFHACKPCTPTWKCYQVP